MVIEVKKVGIQKTSTQDSTQQVQAQVVAVGVGQTGRTKAIEARLEALGISYEQYLIYCEQNKDFPILSLEEQQSYINSKNSEKTKTQTPVMSDAEMQAHCAKIGATVEEYKHLCEQNPEFSSYDIEKQKGLIDTAREKGWNILEMRRSTKEELEENQRLAMEASQQISEDMYEQEFSGKQSTSPKEIIELRPIDLLYSNDGTFNYGVYESLSVDDKLQAFVESYIRNKDGGKSLEGLSEDEINAKIEELKKQIVGDGATEVFDEKSLNFYLSAKMEMLHIAEANNMTLDEYQALSKIEQVKLKNDYLLEIARKNPGDGALLASQKDYLADNYYKTQALIKYLNENNIEHNFDDKTCLSRPEIFAKLREVNKNLPQDSRKRLDEIENEYLHERIHNATKEERKTQEFSDLEVRYFNNTMGMSAKVKKFIGNTLLHDKPSTNYLTEDLANSKFAQFWNNASSNDEKMLVLDNYIDEKLATITDPKEQAKFISDLCKEILHSDADQDAKNENIALVTRLYNARIKRMGVQAKEYLAGLNDKLNMALNSVMSEDLLVSDKAFDNLMAVYSDALKTDDVEKQEQAVKLMYEALNSCGKDNFTKMAQAFIGNGNANVDKMIVHFMHGKTEEEINGLKDFLVYFGQYATKEGNVELAATVYKMAASLQNKALESACSNTPEAFEAANKNKVVEKMDVQNQTRAFNFLNEGFNSIAEQDPSKKGYVVEQLNYLSDQIKNCAAENQLDMHNTMMKSSFNEVVEHTAGNIKDYDVSVQQEALDAVYEYARNTGNQAAVDRALEGLEEKYLTGQIEHTDTVKTMFRDEEIPRMFSEQVLSSDLLEQPEVAELDLSKKLSSSDVAKLSYEEKRQYYGKLFKSASSSDKIKILQQMSSSIRKRVLFGAIAIFAPALLKNMVEAGMGKTMLEANISVEAANKVIATMQNSGTSTVKRQLTELQGDKKFENYFLDEKREEKQEIRNIVVENLENDNSVSLNKLEAFVFSLTKDEKEEIYKKDLNGNILV